MFPWQRRSSTSVSICFQNTSGFLEGSIQRKRERERERERRRVEGVMVVWLKLPFMHGRAVLPERKSKEEGEKKCEQEGERCKGALSRFGGEMVPYESESPGGGETRTVRQGEEKKRETRRNSSEWKWNSDREGEESRRDQWPLRKSRRQRPALFSWQRIRQVIDPWMFYWLTRSVSLSLSLSLSLVSFLYPVQCAHCLTLYYISQFDLFIKPLATGKGETEK